jgi:5-methyltetrahydrofolate--homocysteine methyltransferase
MGMTPRPVLGDGAMGSILLDSGLRMGDCPEAWNLEKPDVIAGVHTAYREAACDFIEANTFGASPIRLARYSLDSKTEDIIKAGIDLARGAAGTSCMVAGSVGPTGALLEPYGEITRDEMTGAFGRQARAMEEAGVDFFLVETMTDPNEAILAIGAIKEASSKPVVATMSFSKGAKGYRTMMGTSPQEAATAMTAAGADYVGTNCSTGPAEALEIMTEMRQVTPVALIAQPNAGLPAFESGVATYPESPETMAKGLAGLLASGVRIIGGCCGTTPAHMKEIASLMGKS